MNLLNDLFQNSANKNKSSLSIMAIDESSQDISAFKFLPIQQKSVSSILIKNQASQDQNQVNIISIFDQKQGPSHEKNSVYAKYLAKYSKIQKMVSILSNKIRKIHYYFFIKMEQSKANKSKNISKSKESIKQQINLLSRLEIPQVFAQKLTKIITLIGNKQMAYKCLAFQIIKSNYNRALKDLYIFYKISIFLLKKKEENKRNGFVQIKRLFLEHVKTQTRRGNPNHMKLQGKKSHLMKVKQPLIHIFHQHPKNNKIKIKQEVGLDFQSHIQTITQKNIPLFPQRPQMQQQDFNPNFQFLLQSQSDISHLIFNSSSNDKKSNSSMSISMPYSPPKAHRSNKTSQKTIKVQILDEKFNFNKISAIKARHSDLTSMTGYCSQQNQKQQFSEKLHRSISEKYRKQQYQVPTFYQFNQIQEKDGHLTGKFQKKIDNFQINTQLNQHNSKKSQYFQQQKLEVPYFIPLIPHSNNSLKNHIEIQNLVAYKKSIETRKSITIKEINKNKQALKQIVGQLRKSKEKQKIRQKEKSLDKKIIIKRPPKNEKEFQKRFSLKGSFHNSPSEKYIQKQTYSRKNSQQKVKKFILRQNSFQKKEMNTESNNSRHNQQRYDQTDESSSINAQLYYKYLKLKNKKTLEIKGKIIETPQKNHLKLSYHQESIIKKQTPNKTLITLSKHPLKYKKIDLKIELKNKQSSKKNQPKLK